MPQEGSSPALHKLSQHAIEQSKRIEQLEACLRAALEVDTPEILEPVPEAVLARYPHLLETNKRRHWWREEARRLLGII